MAAGIVAIFPKTILHAVKKASAILAGGGGSADEGSANLVDLVTAGADGTRIFDVWAVNGTGNQATADLYINDGTSNFFVARLTPPTATTGVISPYWPGQPTGFNLKGMFLQSGYKLRFGFFQIDGRIHVKYANY